jgi:hypothetical protein
MYRLRWGFTADNKAREMRLNQPEPTPLGWEKHHKLRKETSWQNKL